MKLCVQIGKKIWEITFSNIEIGLTLQYSTGHIALGPNDPGKFDRKDILHVSELHHLS